MDTKIYVLLFLTLIGKSICQLRCYACGFSSVDSDRSCLTITDSTHTVECPFKYCTILRQEFLDPVGVVASFTRGCEDSPDFLNHEVTDSTFRTFYRACTTDLCNIVYTLSVRWEVPLLSAGVIFDNCVTFLDLNELGSSMSRIFRSSKSSDFENEALEIHNEYRREHGVPPLVLNKEISKVSQKWAEELAKKDSMSYSLDQEYGESIYCGWSPDPNVKITARDCIDKWYSEINDFSFGREPEVLNCGHFTQIVWRTTKELGIGCAKSKSGKLYVVANYYPPGNYSNQFAKNVPPPGAFQFRSSSTYSSATYSSSSFSRETNNNLSPPSPKDKRNSKNFSDIASDLVTKFRSASLSSDKGEKFEEEFLKAHNEYRKRHGVQSLELSKKLCKYADEWAKTLAKKGTVTHRDQNDYGENIFYAWSSDPNFVVSGRDPVDKWYSEIKDHKFGREPTSLGSGHFSQVVWEDSKEVGVGVAKTKEGQVYVVANYFPPGNIMGSFANKVRPPLS